MSDSTQHWPMPEPRTGALCGADVPSGAILSGDSGAAASCNGCRLILAFSGSDIWIALFDAYDANGPDHHRCTVCAKQGLACHTCTSIQCEEHYDAHSCLKAVKRFYMNWILTGQASDTVEEKVPRTVMTALFKTHKWMNNP